MREFTLYRFEYEEKVNSETGKVELVPKEPYTPIAKLTFGNPTANGVPYTVEYLNDQDVLETPKYSLGENYLNVPLEDVVRVKGNGDLVIWPPCPPMNRWTRPLPS